jgi:hypothetical protein
MWSNWGVGVRSNFLVVVCQDHYVREAYTVLGHHLVWISAGGRYGDSQVPALKKLLEEHQRLAESCGFTLECQNEQEKKENVISFPRLAPATSEKYDQAALQWAL